MSAGARSFRDFRERTVFNINLKVEEDALPRENEAPVRRDDKLAQCGPRRA